MQQNWLGRSEGAYVDFVINGTTEKICVFTTRVETLFGVTFLALSHEHPLATVAKAAGGA